ncbi:hypothetical protein GMMP15_1550010 [Candidatus Magnetomoraceae bacterium gMMP-15]
MDDSTNQVVISPQMVRIEGAGKAYQTVSQSMAIAVQDATDNLRNINTIATTAIGVAISQLLATGDQKYAEIIEIAEKVALKSADTFKTVGNNAGEVLKTFPSE